MSVAAAHCRTALIAIAGGSRCSPRPKAHSQRPGHAVTARSHQASRGHALTPAIAPAARRPLPDGTADAAVHRVAMTPLWLRPGGFHMRFQSQRRHACPRVVATRPSRPNVGESGVNGDLRAGRDVSQPSTVIRPGLLMHVCPKVPFRTQLKAELALRSIRRRNAVRGRKCPTGTYLCPACKSWHLTSKSPSQKPPWSRQSSA